MIKAITKESLSKKGTHTFLSFTTMVWRPLSIICVYIEYSICKVEYCKINFNCMSWQQHISWLITMHQVISSRNPITLLIDVTRDWCCIMLRFCFYFFTDTQRLIVLAFPYVFPVAFVAYVWLIWHVTWTKLPKLCPINRISVFQHIDATLTATTFSRYRFITNMLCRHMVNHQTPRLPITTHCYFTTRVTLCFISKKRLNIRQLNPWFKYVYIPTDLIRYMLVFYMYLNDVNDV